MKKVVIAGGSGFVGRTVTEVFSDAGYEVVVLSRKGGSHGNARTVLWDAKGPGDWYNEVNGATVVINLCGESVLRKWTDHNKAKLRESRIGPTCILGAAIAASEEPAKVWINTSAVGWYGNTGVREISEASPAAEDFLGTLCRDWEAEMDKADTPRTRKVKVRIGVALGYDGDFFKLVTKVTKMFVGGALGHGQQYVPWIHVSDLAKMYLWAAESDASGAINGTAPTPVTNSALMAAFRTAYGRPPVPALPEAVVRTMCSVMGWEPEMLLGGTRAVPSIALAKGFKFEFETLNEALADLIDDVPKAWRTSGAMA